MTFAPSTNARERILAFGGAGSGKTSDWLSVADRYAAEETPPGKFHVIDTDYTAERSLEGHPEAHKVIQKVWTCPEWEDYTKAIGVISKIAKPNDWLVIDMLTPLWDMSQEYYIDRIFGKEVDEFFLKAREQNAKGNPLDGFKDWGVINKMYRSNVANNILRAPCHVFATASAAALSADLESKENRQLFGKWGVKPVGQKTNSHLFHDVLWKQNPKSGVWTLTTVKAREREEQLSLPITNFPTDYLVGVAKWKDEA